MDNSDLTTLPSKIPKPHTVQEQAFADYMRTFADEALIPSLRKQHEQDQQETRRVMDEMKSFYESEQRHDAEINRELIKAIDAQMRDSWNNARLLMADLRDEIKDSRDAKRQLQTAATEIVDKNKSQDTAIAELQVFKTEVAVQIKNLERDVEILISHKAAMVEMLTGNPAAPGIVARIDENSAQIAAFKAMLDNRFASIEKHFEELKQPRGLSKVFSWMNKNPLLLLVIILLVVH